MAADDVLARLANSPAPTSPLPAIQVVLTASSTPLRLRGLTAPHVSLIHIRGMVVAASSVSSRARSLRFRCRDCTDSLDVRPRTRRRIRGRPHPMLLRLHPQPRRGALQEGPAPRHMGVAVCANIGKECRAAFPLFEEMLAQGVAAAPNGAAGMGVEGVG
mmetsp:Transcript_3868/g.9614  ORF Transcript_3868/g.9614 Transcript_3868/m.9614 type:complete len:160 (-) Transcript_3868:496-975(-)